MHILDMGCGSGVLAIAMAKLWGKGKRDIVLGKLLSRFAVGWIQVIYLLIIGVFVFRIQWAERSWVFFAFMSIFALASVSTGIFLGTLFRDPDKAINVTIWFAILLCPLGGLWWPLEVVGPTMRRNSLPRSSGFIPIRNMPNAR